MENKPSILMPSTEWQQIREHAISICKSGLIPNAINSVEKIAIVCMMGYELGLPPMTALNNISVINGKPTLEAKLMLSLVFRRYPDAQYRILESSDQKAVVMLGRPKQQPSKFEFTIQEAQRAGLLQKQNWKMYPKMMLLWRAIAMGCRMMFPDVLTVASHIPDELETITVTPLPLEPEKEIEKRQETEPRREPKREPEPEPETPQYEHQVIEYEDFHDYIMPNGEVEAKFEKKIDDLLKQNYEKKPLTETRSQTPPSGKLNGRLDEIKSQIENYPKIEQ